MKPKQWQLDFVTSGTGADRRPCCPSPRPSPSGRGCSAMRPSNILAASDSSTDGRRFSLSPRERAGVRGKGLCASRMYRNFFVVVLAPFTLLAAELKEGESPADRLPPHIKRVTWF